MMILDRTGETREMNCGLEAQIVKYINNENIDVMFLKNKEIIKHVKYINFKKGAIKPKFYPMVYGVGYIGNSKARDYDGKLIKSYDIWTKILQRCYDEKSRWKYPNYSGCTVCNEWLNYTNFKKWYDDNYYEIKGQRMCVDKDILHKGNKIYSPEHCLIVPNNINVIFNVRKGNSSGFQGVSYIKNKNVYLARSPLGDGTQKCLGYFDNKEDAFESYRKAKEQFIKDMADKYVHEIPKKLYDAMYNYKI